MWLVFFILALIGVLVLMYYLVIEINELEKKVNALVESVRKHYGA